MFLYCPAPAANANSSVPGVEGVVPLFRKAAVARGIVKGDCVWTFMDSNPTAVFLACPDDVHLCRCSGVNLPFVGDGAALI
ncbi:hypothetical protein TcWFU_004405 [Taenia crassiceps]|uniref:Uncharacterized protein n=1 Tax=Taenia crassiceps TaxID=6207 RepID=A0ABR4QL03_9CEST